MGEGEEIRDGFISSGIAQDDKGNGMMLEEENISKSSVELVKNLSDILEKGRLTSLNITINDIKGDNYNDNAVNSGMGHDNYYNSVEPLNSKNNSNINKEKKTVIYLSDYAEVYKYLKDQQYSPYCSLIIALSIFNNSQFDLVCSEAKILYDLLVEDNREITDRRGRRVVVKKEAFEISRQEATSYFGIRFYQDMLITVGGRLKTSFIGFEKEEHSTNVLRCVYSEFVTLKDKVTAYLTKLICSEKVTLYVAAINTLKKLCDINPEYFISNIVNRIIKNKSIPSDIAVSQIICSIARNSNNEQRAEKYLSAVPNVDKDIHYYIITLMMCQPLSYTRDKVAKLIRPVLWELINQPRLQHMLGKLNIDLPEDDNFINNIDLFFNIGNRYAEYYIALVSQMYDIVTHMRCNDSKRDVAHLVILLFIQEDLKESQLNTSDSRKFKDMVFIRLVLRDEETPYL
jgi:hypothetical protein